MKKQRKCTPLEFFLVLALVGILGFTGWFVWRSQNKIDGILSVAASTSSPDPLKAHADIPVLNALAPGGDYLTIQRWNVEIPVTGFELGSYSSGDTDIPDHYELTTKQITNEARTIGCNDTSIGFIYQSSKKPSMVGLVKGIYAYSDSVKIGDYYYEYHLRTQAACIDDATGIAPTKLNQLMQDAMKSWLESFPKTERV